MKKLISIIAITAALAMGVADAKSYGSRSSSSFSRSSSFSSKPKSYSSKPKTYGGSTSKTKATKPTTSNAKSAADQKRYQSAVKNGKAFESRSSARTAFKNDKANAQKYTSKYASEPKTRPEHIPQTYKDSKTGNTYNVTYNQDRGGYGYWGGGGPGLGTFIMYDVMTDLVVMDMMMNRQGYHVGAAPAVVHTSTGPGAGLIFLGVIVGVVLLLICVVGFVGARSC